MPVQVFSCKFGKISEEKFFCRIYPGDYLCTLSNKVIPRFLSKYFTEEKKGPKFFQTTQCLREIFVTFVRALQNLLQNSEPKKTISRQKYIVSYKKQKSRQKYDSHKIRYQKSISRIMMEVKQQFTFIPNSNCYEKTLKLPSGHLWLMW